jgi:hypothetical protein
VVVCERAQPGFRRRTQLPSAAASLSCGAFTPFVDSLMQPQRHRAASPLDRWLK